MNCLQTRLQQVCTSVFVCLPKRSLTITRRQQTNVFSPTVAELCWEVSFEPLASSIRLRSLQFARLRFQMFALFFSAGSDKHISVSSSAKVYGPVGLGESQFTVCWMHCIPPLLILHIPSFPALSSVVFVILTLKGFWGMLI